MINIYTLNTCNQCKWLIEELNSTDLVYRNFDADEHDEVATKIEDLLNTTIYPIVHICKKDQDIYMISEDTAHYYFDNSIVIHTYRSIPHLIQLIKTNT